MPGIHSRFFAVNVYSGTGHYKRNQAIHQKHIDGKGGIIMYQRAGKELRGELDKIWRELPHRFAASLNSAISQIKDELDTMLERHTAIGICTSSRKEVDLRKVALKTALKPHFESLEKAWEKDTEVESDKEDESEKDGKEESEE